MVTYSSAFLPPAPTLEVVVHNAQTGDAITVLAKIDTGADGSVIPVTLVEQIGLIPFDTLVSIAFDGSTEEQTSYMVWSISRLLVARLPILKSLPHHSPMS